MKLWKNHGLHFLSATILSILAGSISAQTAGSSSAQFLSKTNIGDNDSVPTVSCTDVVNTISALERAADTDLTAGTTLCLADGTYTGLNIDFGGVGSADNPITVAAQNPGKVVIDGTIEVNMSGEYVVLQGFIFREGNVDERLIQTRSESRDICQHCRVTENTILDMNGLTSDTRWIQVYGTDNRIDHNRFSGKTAQGPLLVIERVVTDEPDRTLIDHNYFGDRPPAQGRAYALSSDNEYEAMRLGDSRSHTSDSFAIVEHNYFEHFDGEAEVISVKAGNVTVRHNTLRDNRGSLVTRHGENTTIDNNFIFGDGNPFAGGIRIVDANHSVTNNYISGARNPSSSFYGGILIHNSDLSTTNGYQFLENVLIANNTVVDSVNSINLSGGREEEDARNVYLVNNIVDNAVDAAIRNPETILEDSVISGNIVFGARLTDSSSITNIEGFTFSDPELVEDSLGVFRPSLDNSSLIANLGVDTGNFELPSLDMDGQTRTQRTFIGADEVLTEVPSVTNRRGVLDASLVGPISYEAPVSEFKVPRIELTNPEFSSGDLTGWESSSATIVTNASDVFSLDNSVRLDGTSAFLAQNIDLSTNTNYTFSFFAKGAGKIQVTVDDEVIESEFDNSRYRFVSVSFNTGNTTSVSLEAIAINDNGSAEAFVDSARLVSHESI
ncbi:polysaccharide lyase 6 family protein [Alteromonas sp. 5E99-2]|uniref:polysaccharide lyase 6 family protein n=1 Tax=Alteromonas sp. 5E99-2 TaxID=2817683 RepID=UPI001A97E4ED|nr:polysaccharide lyase 6 family protein [Alteromonas sp. 5E99-2]MBO1256065.1 polysaccharide lyase 6 family protein [Alteromonas sp. 5E99-2]